MDALFDADLVGVDILQYPVDSELSEVNADIPESKQESSGRDIPWNRSRRNYHLEESSSSSSCRSRTPEVASEDSDRSVEDRPKPRPKIGTPRGSVGQALQEETEHVGSCGAL